MSSRHYNNFRYCEEQLNSKGILRIWTQAAREFCMSKEPNYGDFVSITLDAALFYAILKPNRHVTFRQAMDFTFDVMAQSVGAKPSAGSRRLDAALLRSNVFHYEFLIAVKTLLSACAEEGVKGSFEFPEYRHVRQTIRRRKRWLREHGLRGPR